LIALMINVRFQNRPGQPARPLQNRRSERPVFSGTAQKDMLAEHTRPETA
jgi:hypothetical protein